MTAPATMQLQLEALRSARASGVRTVEFEAGNGTRRKIKYRSDAELAAAIADLERRLGSRIHTVKLHTSKGL